MKHKPKIGKYQPDRCWVGDTQKICYSTEQEAVQAARLAEHDHQLPLGSLSVYRCEYADHWHLASSNLKNSIDNY